MTSMAAAASAGVRALAPAQRPARHRPTSPGPLFSDRRPLERTKKENRRIDPQEAISLQLNVEANLQLGPHAPDREVAENHRWHRLESGHRATVASTGVL